MGACKKKNCQTRLAYICHGVNGLFNFRRDTSNSNSATCLSQGAALNASSVNTIHPNRSMGMKSIDWCGAGRDPLRIVSRCVPVAGLVPFLPVCAKLSCSVNVARVKGHRYSTWHRDTSFRRIRRNIDATDRFQQLPRFERHDVSRYRIRERPSLRLFSEIVRSSCEQCSKFASYGCLVAD